MTSPQTAPRRRKALLWFGMALVGSLLLLGFLSSQGRTLEAASAPSADTSPLPAVASPSQSPTTPPSRSEPSAPAVTVTPDELHGLQSEYEGQNWSEHVTDVTQSGQTTVVETDLEDLGQVLPAGVTLSETMCIIDGYGLEDGQVVHVQGPDGTNIATMQFQQC